MGSASTLYYGIKLINMMIIIMITMMMMQMMMIIINNDNNSKKKGTVHQKDFYLVLSPGPRNGLIS